MTGPVTFRGCETGLLAHDWGYRSPGAGLPADGFSARWRGQLMFAGGKTTFRARAEDGIRVWIDGKLLVDRWRDTAARTYSKSVSVAAGAHSVTVEYYESGGAAVEQFSWF